MLRVACTAPDAGPGAVSLYTDRVSSPDGIRSAAGAGVQAPGQPPFFIVGTGRCGSTLLQAMLMGHSRIAIPPETHFFARFDPALRFGDPLPAGREEAYVDACAAEPVFRELGLERERLLAAILEGRRDARALFTWVLEQLLGEGVVREAHVGEKTPRHEQNVPRIASLFPRARFIHIHRDPRDVVASIRNMDWRSSDSLAQVAKECRRTYRRQARFAAELGPERYQSVRFEDLVADPERELRRLCAFLGEEFEPGMLRYPERRESGYLDSERGWKELTRRPLDRSRVGRYRQLLRPGEIRRVEGILRDELPSLGYERTRAPRWRPDWWWADLRDGWRRQRRAGRDASARG